MQRIEPQSYIGTWRRFGPVGPAYEIIAIGDELPDGDRTVKIRLAETGEEVDYTRASCINSDRIEIPFRAGDSFFDPGNAGKILIVGAVEVVDRDTNEAKPRRKGAKYLDTRSGRIRLAMIADNSAASIEAFVRANVKPGATLLTDGHASYPGLIDYRHDPRVVGKMAAHIVLPWIHRVFALMKRWELGTYHGLRRKHVDTYLNEYVFRYNRRFYRRVSFETILGLAAHREPASYWDVIGRANPRKGNVSLRRTPRRRKTATGMRQDGAALTQTVHSDQTANVRL